MPSTLVFLAAIRRDILRIAELGVAGPEDGPENAFAWLNTFASAAPAQAKPATVPASRRGEPNDIAPVPEGIFRFGAVERDSQGRSHWLKKLRE